MPQRGTTVKHRLIVSVITAVLVVLGLSQLYAQDEKLTLEGLAKPYFPQFRGLVIGANHITKA